MKSNGMPKFYEPSQHFLTSDGVRINFIDVKGESTINGNVNTGEDSGQIQTPKETK